MRLFIVESPSKAKTIKSYLGRDYTVVATMGHIKDLPKEEMGIDPAKLEPKYVFLPGKKKIVGNIIKIARNCDLVLLASDKDREGEMISFHMKEVLSKYNGNIKRVEFTEVTKDSILNSIKMPRDIDMNLVNAQKARRLLDRIVGYVISPILYKHLRKNFSGSSFSAGRVQSPALRIVCEREIEIRNFVPINYYEVIVECQKENKIFQLKLISELNDGKEIRFSTSNRIDDEKFEEIKSSFKKDRLVIMSMKRYNDIIKPLPPFKTSTLQQDASAKLGFTPSKTMKIAQDLYEGMNVDGEYVGLITYMRTDSVKISEYALEQTRKFVRERIGEEYLPPRPRIYESVNWQSAHECIRPTDVYRVPASVKGKIPEDHYKLYDLIWRRFLASQLMDAVVSVFEILSSEGRYNFFGVSKSIVKKNFMNFYPHSVPEDVFFPQLEEGEVLNVIQLKGLRKKTQPPPRYTEATLIKKLEEEGIGRPSTYAMIVSTLLQRKYVIKQNKSLVPTELGFAVFEFLKSNFPTVVDLKLTAYMESLLDKIESGEEKDWKKILISMVKQAKVPFNLE
ncbi:MAG: type I DNA topoisomerase [Brevinematales bacterium]|nr:type I DNA topoisomerase [Brevinematales bacterium]